MSRAPWSRRRFVLSAAGFAMAAPLVGLIARPKTAAADTTPTDDEYATLRATWRDLILGTDFDPAAEPFATLLASLGTNARNHLARMAPTAGSLWPDAVYADPEPDTDQESYGYSAKLNDSYNRLNLMAQAYSQPATGVTGDAALRDAIIAGLDHLYADRYNERTTRYGNWWNWQIGSPQALTDCCVLLYDHLTTAQIANYSGAIDHFVPASVFDSYTGTSTGANRVDLCRGVLLRGIVEQNPAKIELAAGALAPVFPYVTTGDGFYADGSFIQHTRIPYIGGYGAVLHSGVGRILALLRGSRWELSDPNLQLFLDTVDDAIAPFVYNGLMMDNVSSRGISRAGTSEHTRAHGLLATIVLIGQGASPAENARWRAMVKGWMERDYYAPPLSNPGLSLTSAALLSALRDDATVEAAPEPAEHRLFHNMDRATHRRPGWAASISMASKRTAHYEYGNGEHARGYHTGAGWLSWWGDDFGLEHYSDAFWPTVDPYRLPGITASKKPVPDGFGGEWGQAGGTVPPTAWVGGTTDGEYAAIGQHLRGIDSTMNARKSWFCLDDSIVCLGSGITSTDGFPVETTIDNRNLGVGGAPTLLVDGARQPSTQGWTGRFGRARWAHIAGIAGYVFPGGADLRAIREERTGAWRDINAGGPADPITRRYLTLYTDHGNDPVNAGYAYVLLPGADARTTARLAEDQGWLRILVNTAAQQGVRVQRLGLTAVNFWAAGHVQQLTVSAPASVLVRENRDRTATIVVSDPAREATSLQVQWDRDVAEVLSAPSSLVAASHTDGKLSLTFGDLTGLAGAPQKVVVRLG